MTHTGRAYMDLQRRLKRLQPEVDFQALILQMPEQTNPRRKLTELQRNGILIRLKKGFYVFDPAFLGRAYSPEIVSNLIYGPSYLSLETALSYYELIPERVEEWTSVTRQKNKHFETRIGVFSYRHLHHDLYPLGVTQKETDEGRNYLIASPIKAVLDLLTLKFESKLNPSRQEVLVTLVEDLRIDWNLLKDLTKEEKLSDWQKIYKRRIWCHHFLSLLEENS